MAAPSPPTTGLAAKLEIAAPQEKIQMADVLGMSVFELEQVAAKLSSSPARKSANVPPASASAAPGAGVAWWTWLDPYWFLWIFLG